MPNPKLETYKNKATGTVYDLTDADAQSKVSATVDLLKDTTGWIGKNHLNSDDYRVYNVGDSNITATPYYNSNGHIEKIRLNGQTGSGSGNYAQAQFSQRGNATAIILEQKDYVFSIGNTVPSGCRLQAGYTHPDSGSYTPVLDSTTDGALFTSPTDTQKWTIQFVINAGVTLTDYDVYPMISDPEKYALSPSFEPYHESVEDWYWDNNAKLGTHQWFDFSKVEATTNLVEGSTYDDFTVSGTGTYRGVVFDIDVIPNTDYRILTDAVVTSGKGYINISPYPSGSGFANSGEFASSKTVDFTFNSGNNSKIKIACFSTTATSDTGNIEYKNFLLALADDTNTECTPYDMTNRQLTEILNAVTAFTEIPNNSSLNDIKTEGSYYCANATNAGTITDKPNTTTNAGFRLDVIKLNTTNAIIQTLQYNTQPSLFCKRYADYQGNFGSWYKFTGTVVS